MSATASKATDPARNMSAPPRKSEAAGSAARRRNPLDLVMGSRLGKLLTRVGIAPRRSNAEGLLDLAAALLSLRGSASGPALASAFFDLYEASALADRQAFLSQVHGFHPHDPQAIDTAIQRWQKQGDEASAQALHDATQSPSQKLIRVLNLAPKGTQKLIAMRSDLLAIGDRTPGIKALDREFEKAFAAWFNAGFLELRRIGWDSPAALLDRIIRYEAVHSIDGWDDLRRRVEPADRRCYGFFHPQMKDDPLIFVEVALTQTLPGAIGQIIAEKRKTIEAREASCAIFYSISNCQDGLRGVPFGNYLIKRVVGRLQAELPQLRTFATLSPLPRFAKWLDGELGKGAKLPPAGKLREYAASYLVDGRSPGGGPLDPVARFHLGNGARLEAIHANGDPSPNGMRQSHGVMVNYVYDLDEIEANHFALNELDTVAASKAVLALLTADAPRSAKKKRK